MEECADEYDRYQLHVVSMLSRGGSKDEATVYLTGIASEHMGLSVVDPTPQRRRPICDSRLPHLPTGWTEDRPLNTFMGSRPSKSVLTPKTSMTYPGEP